MKLKQKKIKTYQQKLKAKRASELVIANKKLVFENKEKSKRASELEIAVKLKAKRASELLIANKKLVFENKEKAKRADELLIANKEKEKDVLYLKKIKEKLEYYKRVVRNSNDAVIIQDFNGTVKAWNKVAEKTYGYSEEEMLGKHITSIIKKEYRTEAKKNIASIRRGKPTFKSQQTRVTKDGKELFINIIYSPIYEAEEIIEVATTEEDVTERKKAEEEIKNKIEELQKMNSLMIGRELKMIELKEKIKELSKAKKGDKK